MLELALHIPDGFLSGGVAAVCAIPAIAAVAYGLKVADKTLDEARVPLLGVLAAFIFAAQMLNFPIAGGTSGHFLGATLAAVLLGPWIACLVMAVVLVVQAFVFADGGVSALGANVLDMGVIGALLGGFALAAAVKALPPTRGAYLAAVGVTAWSAVVIAAAVVAVQLAISDTVSFGTVLGAMVGTHMLIGLGEAAITVAAVSAVLAARPDLIAIQPRFDTTAAPAGAGLPREA